jgi:hypothetical protein
MGDFKESVMRVRSQPSAEYRLHTDQPLRLEDAGGRVVEAIAGVSWITAYGQQTDFILRPGQRFVVPNDGLTLVEGLGRSRIRIAAPLAQSWAQRVLREGHARLSEALMRMKQGLQPTSQG